MTDWPWGDRWRGWLGAPEAVPRAWIISVLVLIASHLSFLPDVVKGLLVVAFLWLTIWNWRYQRALRRRQREEAELDRGHQG